MSTVLNNLKQALRDLEEEKITEIRFIKICKEILKEA